MTAITAEQAQWMAGSDTGLSSKTLWAHMVGMAYRDIRAPLDPADLGRCVRLLNIFPEWKPRITEMAAYPEWAGIVAKWDELAALYEEELAAGTGYAPKCYDAMKAVRA